VSGYASAVVAAFDRSRAQFEALVLELTAAGVGGGWHARTEQLLHRHGREVLRQVMQDLLDLRAAVEPRCDGVTGADTVVRTRVERGHQRRLMTVFGAVTATRLAYRAPWVANLYPSDAQQNLPAGRHSYGLRELVAVEAARGSFDAAGQAIERASGVRLGKRQVEALARAAVLDVDAFYATRRPAPARSDQLLVLQFDGKGIVMIPAALRPDTAKAAHAAAARASVSGHRRTARLSPAEHHGRKRMAEVAAVYDIAPFPRTAADVINPDRTGEHPPRPRRPTATGKWLTASVTADLTEVIAAGFDEACRRDPHQQRTWVALVDGNRAQIKAITTQAERRGVRVHIVLDFIHVLEYLWKAAKSLPPATDPATQQPVTEQPVTEQPVTEQPVTERWVTERATEILHGHAAQVAAELRHTTPTPAADKAATLVCADYLTTNQPHLNYHHALSAGWPIATGVIEGACRHLIKDRMDITGARWGLATAEAILQLRALTTNGDFNDYWQFHQQQQHRRIHQVRYQHPHQAHTPAA
jgi:hypothetical protein